MPANYVLLNRVQLNAPTTSVTFSNIPQTGYTDLKIVVSARTDSNAGQPWAGLRMSINGSTSNLLFKAIYGDGSSPSSGGGTNAEPGIASSSLASSNAFGNSECYIANYTSSAFKPFSARSVQENNGTTALSASEANLWSSTSAITSLTVTNQGPWNFVQYSTFSLYGIAATGSTPTVIPKAIGGDIVVNDGTYWYHAFLSSGVFTPSSDLSCNYLVVAGGGGGGWNGGGGGGAGGLVSSTASLVGLTNYGVTIGAGGAGGILSNNVPALKGNSSSFGSFVATGGGIGGSSSSTDAIRQGGSGGSGGGASGYGIASGSTAITTGGAVSPSGQGNAGGNAYGNNVAPYGYGDGGGGGGAGTAGSSGSNGSPWSGGNGGDGATTYSSWGSATKTGENVGGTYYYAGGGAGFALSTGTRARGGYGGGGQGGVDGGADSTIGTINTGGGGGGSRGNNTDGKAGGSGIVIVRYTMV
jgi:hypothetical protein